MTKLNKLTDEFDAWCKANNKNQCAFEMLISDDDLSEQQYAYVKDFVKRWENVQK